MRALWAALASLLQRRHASLTSFERFLAVLATHQVGHLQGLSAIRSLPSSRQTMHAMGPLDANFHAPMWSAWERSRRRAFEHGRLPTLPIAFVRRQERLTITSKPGDAS